MLDSQYYRCQGAAGRECRLIVESRNKLLKDVRKIARQYGASKTRIPVFTTASGAWKCDALYFPNRKRVDRYVFRRTYPNAFHEDEISLWSPRRNKRPGCTLADGLQMLSSRSLETLASMMNFSLVSYDGKTMKSFYPTISKLGRYYYVSAPYYASPDPSLFVRVSDVELELLEARHNQKRRVERRRPLMSVP